MSKRCFSWSHSKVHCFEVEKALPCGAVSPALLLPTRDLAGVDVPADLASGSRAARMPRVMARMLTLICLHVNMPAGYHDSGKYIGL